MEIKNVIILSGGRMSFGREVHSWLKDVEKIDDSVRFKGFLSNENVLPNDISHLYLGKRDEYSFKKNDYILIGTGYNKFLKEHYEFAKKKGIRLFTLIHPTVIIGRNVKIGEASIICPNCILTCDIEVGIANIFNVASTVGHDVSIGNFNVISAHSDITGKCKIEDFNFFGTSVKMLPGSKIGSNNRVGAGSVILKGFKDNLIIFGNPAQKIGKNK